MYFPLDARAVTERLRNMIFKVPRAGRPARRVLPEMANRKCCTRGMAT